MLHTNDNQESIATMESELEQFNIASLSNDTILETVTSSKNKFSMKTNFVCQIDYVI